ncbi:MAG: glycine zipper domain-containing protein [Candidatus Competibacteraceae bacterium]
MSIQIFSSPGKKTLVAAIVIGLSLQGCATTGGATTDDQQATAAQGAVVGAVLGALIGGGISKNKRVGALTGAAIGGLAGYALGTSVAERKAQYANEEDFLVAEINRNDQFIQEAADQNYQLNQEIAQLERESRRLTREYRAGKVSRDALAQQKANLEKQLSKAKQINSLTEKQLADTTEVYKEAQQKRGSQDQYTRKLEKNLAQIKETKQQSSQNVASLQQIYDSTSI